MSSLEQKHLLNNVVPLDIFKNEKAWEYFPQLATVSCMSDFTKRTENALNQRCLNSEVLVDIGLQKSLKKVKANFKEALTTWDVDVVLDCWKLDQGDIYNFLDNNQI